VRLMLPFLLCALSLPNVARAEIFWGRPPVSGGVMTGPEAGFGAALPGATATEQRAWLVWNLRSALNVAALQCGRFPMLFTENNYNSMLRNHEQEFGDAFKSLTGYFKRTSKTAPAGQKALDTFGTRTYSAFSAVSGILVFCTNSGDVGAQARFTPRGSIHILASEKLKTLFNAVKSTSGEQMIRRVAAPWRAPLPNLDERCWKGRKPSGKC
jgi:hypothetical protein